MKVVVCQAVDALVSEANSWLEARLKASVRSRVFLPAGNTPRPLYADWESRRPPWLAAAEFLQIDDVATGANRGVFGEFFRSELPHYPVRPILASDTASSAELALLGFGLNGHIAFHEPGLPADFHFGEVDLAARTVSELKLEPGARGRTYGADAFLACRSLLLLVWGDRKAEAWKKFQAGDPAVPASLLRGHPDLTVLLDGRLA